jgi:asparagine synthase (glutamine-hydrolysing)
MCGISGVVLKSGQSVSHELMKRMGDQMANRGPDAAGYFVQKNLGFAHRRLSIIDLSEQANQPMFNETGKVGVVFNGEIYNFQELREELKSCGHVFKCNSDTEVIVHAYEEWGTESFRKFNGIFAFGLWDWRNTRPILYLVRDRFGTKPLFYSFKDQQIAFASELKPLMQVPWISKKIDRSSLFSYIKFSHVPTPASILQDVRQVQAGAYLRFENGNLQEHQFWNPLELVNSESSLSQRSESEYLAELDQILKKVIARQVISDVPLGCFLSGGVDSSLLVAAYQESFSNPLLTFSVGYKEKEFDESSYASEVANVFKTHHHSLILKPSDFFELIPAIPTYYDQPMADPTLLSTLLLCKFAKKQVTVALSGDGGDELFFGYSYQQILFNLLKVAQLPTSVRSGFFNALNSVIPEMPGGKVGNKIQQLKKVSEILQFQNDEELFQYFIGMVGPIRMDRLARLLEGGYDTSIPIYKGLKNEVKDLAWQDQISQLFIRTFMLDTVLVKTDRAGMAFGLEARVPFLDNELADFSARLPFQFKFKGGVKKYLLRKLLAQKMEAKAGGSEIARRKKQGFSIPLRDWLRGDLKYLLDEYLNTPRIQREGLFNAAEVQALVKAHGSSRANHSHLLWTLVSFQMWKERYLE